MTRTGALVWKEWRDHRAAVFVFAAIVPLVSWSIQRWAFKFAEPDWTWKWIIPLCVGLAVAFVAADSFAMDIATSRMSSFAALPVSLRRHFGARACFLGFVAAATLAWTTAANLAIVGWWGKAGAVALHLERFESSECGLLMAAAAMAAVLVFSCLGVGGFRAVLGGGVLAAVAYFATTYAVGRLVPVSLYARYAEYRPGAEWLVAAAVLLLAAYVGFVGGRAHAASRQRGVVFVAIVLVGAFGAPAASASWKAYRGWMIEPDDPELSIQSAKVSPDGRYVAICGAKYGQSGAHRSWIARIDGGALIDWPRRNEGLAGWTDDGLVWSIPYDRATTDSNWGRFVRPETGETASTAARADLETRLAAGFSVGPRWAQWLRWNFAPTKSPANVYSWTLRNKDGGPERTVDARSCPAPTKKVGEALIVTAENRLALVDLAGGEPRVVADDVTSIGLSSCSPGGRYFIVGTSRGYEVLDSTDWSAVWGPLKVRYVLWCESDAERAIVMIVDSKSPTNVRYFDVRDRREIAPDPSLHLDACNGSVQTLADGRFVVQSMGRRVLLLDADGKFIRRLFPPEE